MLKLNHVAELFAGSSSATSVPAVVAGSLDT